MQRCDAAYGREWERPAASVECVIRVRLHAQSVSLPPEAVRVSFIELPAGGLRCNPATEHYNCTATV